MSSLFDPLQSCEIQETTIGPGNTIPAVNAKVSFKAITYLIDKGGDSLPRQAAVQCRIRSPLQSKLLARQTRQFADDPQSANAHHTTQFLMHSVHKADQNVGTAPSKAALMQSGGTGNGDNYVAFTTPAEADRLLEIAVKAGGLDNTPQADTTLKKVACALGILDQIEETQLTKALEQECVETLGAIPNTIAGFSKITTLLQALTPIRLSAVQGNLRVTTAFLLLHRGMEDYANFDADLTTRALTGVSERDHNVAFFSPRADADDSAADNIPKIFAKRHIVMCKAIGVEAQLNTEKADPLTLADKMSARSETSLPVYPWTNPALNAARAFRDIVVEHTNALLPSRRFNPIGDKDKPTNTGIIEHTVVQASKLTEDRVRAMAVSERGPFVDSMPTGPIKKSIMDLLEAKGSWRTDDPKTGGMRHATKIAAACTVGGFLIFPFAHNHVHEQSKDILFKRWAQEIDNGLEDSDLETIEFAHLLIDNILQPALALADACDAHERALQELTDEKLVEMGLKKLSEKQGRSNWRKAGRIAAIVCVLADFYADTGVSNRREPLCPEYGDGAIAQANIADLCDNLRWGLQSGNVTMDLSLGKPTRGTRLHFTNSKELLYPDKTLYDFAPAFCLTDSASGEGAPVSEKFYFNLKQLFDLKQPPPGCWQQIMASRRLVKPQFPDDPKAAGQSGCLPEAAGKHPSTTTNETPTTISPPEQQNSPASEDQETTHSANRALLFHNYAEQPSNGGLSSDTGTRTVIRANANPGASKGGGCGTGGAESSDDFDMGGAESSDDFDMGGGAPSDEDTVDTNPGESEDGVCETGGAVVTGQPSDEDTVSLGGEAEVPPATTNFRNRAPPLPLVLNRSVYVARPHKAKPQQKSTPAETRPRTTHRSSRKRASSSGSGAPTSTKKARTTSETVGTRRSQRVRENQSEQKAAGTPKRKAQPAETKNQKQAKQSARRELAKARSKSKYRRVAKYITNLRLTKEEFAAISKVWNRNTNRESTLECLQLLATGGPLPHGKDKTTRETKAAKKGSARKH